MTLRQRFQAIRDTRLFQGVVFATGVLLILVTPLVSALPGPGGIFVFAAGLTLILRSSLWAKKHYVRFKRWQPRAGGWADWGLRRASAKRREAIRKERERAESPPPGEAPRIDDPLPGAGMELSPVDHGPAASARASTPPQH
ncbi:hypothetical protein GCM10022281_00780 [Sphingomonas rosea]|uniref:Transmembrane protein (PGPGW) n=1 Tax=Sphingomonas rosea TaxID=335605 RepID=A0ABP7TH72_9SPHN